MKALFTPWLPASLFLFALPFAACSCDEDILTKPPEDPKCELDSVCPGNQVYRDGQCKEGRCQADSDCCPGQKCNIAAGFCADQLVSCSRDRECQVPGQRCIDFRGGTFCGYPNATNMTGPEGTQSCDSNADCAEGRSCFNQRCVLYAPCGGGCPAGQVCDIDSNTCYQAERKANLDAGVAPATDCTETCGAGQMLVLKDPDTMSGPVCCFLRCECKTLPPVLPGQLGFYADITSAGNEVLVSAYDQVYGDLVVARFDAQGRRVGADYIDGLPAAGDIVGDPAGPRGGRIELGPNVGTHTSIDRDTSDVLHVSYRDEVGGTLKYARRAAGTWSTSTVDESGNTGLYTSIAVGADGLSRIAYLMAEGTIGADPTPMTALKLATARVPSPSSAADWSIEVVDQRIKPEPICGGGCGQNAACVDGTNGPACEPTVLGCQDCAANDVACVDRAGVPTCEDKVPIVIFDDLVEATGLFASLAIASDGSPHIAFYDRIDRVLKYAVRGGSGFTVSVLDGDDPTAPTDSGQHASIAIAPNGGIAIAYLDVTNDRLYFYDLATNTKELIDSGLTPPNVRVVGADASLLFDAAGRPAIAYQDGTNLDLLYARRLGTTWSTEVLRGSAPVGVERGLASGFYTAQTLRGNTAFVATLDITFDPEGELLLNLVVVPKSLD